VPLSELVRGRWCVVLLNVFPTAGNESGDIKDSCCEEPRHIFDQFLKYHIVLQMWGSNIQYFQAAKHNNSNNQLVTILSTVGTEPSATVWKYV
jgi:hypothetical protein